MVKNAPSPRNSRKSRRPAIEKETGTFIRNPSEGNTGVTYAWDAENRLVGADTNGDGNLDVVNRYDAEGNRVLQVVGGEEHASVLRHTGDATQSLFFGVLEAACWRLACMLVPRRPEASAAALVLFAVATLPTRGLKIQPACDIH